MCYFYITDLVVPGTSSFVLQEESQTSPKKRVRQPRYVGDISTHELSPKRAKHCLYLAKKKIKPTSSQN